MTLVVDTSAFVATLLGAPGAEWLGGQLEDAPRAVVAAPALVELGIVLMRKFPSDPHLAEVLVRGSGVHVAPFDEDLSSRAVDAFRRWGKTRHPAGLNLGDCFTYALAEQTGWPILCVGDDFARTDLPVLRPPR